MLPRRVLLVGPYPPPYGGLSVQLQQWQRYLAETRGWSCEVLNISEKRTEPVPGAQPVRGYADFLMKLARYARRDYLIHLFTNGHNFKSWLSALACALAACLNHRRSLLVFGSGNLPKYIEESGAVNRAVVKMAARLAGQIVCRNEEMVEALAKLGTDRGKISIVSGYYGMFDRSGEIPEALETFIAGHRPVIGAIATRLSPEYGVPQLLEAFASLKQDYPNVGLVLIGIEKLEQLHDGVYLAGPLANPIAMAVMSRLSVFVRPTLFDGDSRSVREALALGIPVVASDTGLRPASVRLFEKGNVPEMSACIRAVLEKRPPQLNAPPRVDSVNQMLSLYDRILQPDTMKLPSSAEEGWRTERRAR